MAVIKKTSWTRWLLLSGFALILAGTVSDIYQRYGILIRDRRLMDMGSFPLVLGFVAATSVLVVLLAFFPHIIRPINRFRWSNSWLKSLLAAALAVFTVWLLIKSVWGGEVFSPRYLRTFLVLTVTGFNAWLFTEGVDNFFEWRAWLKSLLLMGSVSVIGIELQGAVDYPFQLSWSEGNRIWDYSIMFGMDRYRYPASQPIDAFINPVRQFMWGIPFLFKGVNIQLVRLWSGLLFCLPYFILGILVFKASVKKGWAQVWLPAMWSMLFLNQGPIYAPLVISAILVTMARFIPFWLGFLLVAASGYLAQVSRITWMFAPAIWAVLIFMLESGVPGKPMNWKNRVLKAGTMGFAGFLGGFLFEKILDLFKSGAAAGPSKSSYVSVDGITSLISDQPLIWSRLFPNPTYPLGILISLLLACLPVLVLILWLRANKKWPLDWMQVLTAILALAGTLVVGIVVSVKIGGGNNLHNLDMFLITLLIVAGFAWQNGARDLLLNPPRPSLVLVVLFMIIYPFFPNLLNTTPLIFPDQQRVNETLEDIQGYVDWADSDSVLFIDQRQLLTFSYIKDVDLIPEYEKKHIMDNAMRANQVYFDQFYKDLSKHKYSLIVSEPLWIRFQGEDYQFGNENDVWVKWVSIPVLCYYKVEYTDQDLGIQLLTPKPKASDPLDSRCPVLKDS